MTYLLLIIGFVFLIKGADILVEGAGSIAKKFGISNLVIGLTIVAFGTSAPEFVVSFLSSIEGKTQMAISNVIGSNIANTLLILGVTSLICSISIPKSTIKKEIPFGLFISILLFILISFSTFGLGKINGLGTIDGVILLILFIGFLYYTYTISKNNTDNEDEIELLPNWKSAIYIILGLVGLIYGGQLIVDNAVKIAQSFGISDAFIGLTIVAIGTSLPELASSIMAALKKKTDMAVGAIIGSNIFNILWILGFSATFATLDGYNGISLDLLVMSVGVLLLIIFAYTHKKMMLGKIEGLILVSIYFGYLTYLIMNI